MKKFGIKTIRRLSFIFLVIIFVIDWKTGLIAIGSYQLIRATFVSVLICIRDRTNLRNKDKMKRLNTLINDLICAIWI